MLTPVIMLIFVGEKHAFVVVEETWPQHNSLFMHVEGQYTQLKNVPESDLKSANSQWLAQVRFISTHSCQSACWVI